MSEKLGPIVFGKDNEEVFLGRDFGTQKNYSDEVAFEKPADYKSAALPLSHTSILLL